MNYDELIKKPIMIAGPCVIESESVVMKIAEEIKLSSEKHNEFNFIFKSSFDKANRTSIDSYRGIGIEESLKLFEKIKNELELSITTDIHEPYQADMVKNIVDIIQIPAFLCRQTDLLVVAGKTDKIINIKKAQFLSGKAMKNPVKKVESTGNKKILLTERGNIIGYDNLVVDFRNILEMKKLGYPVIMDATHSVQQPGSDITTGGNSEFAPYMAKSAVIWGASGIFNEIHINPKEALSDGPNMLTIDEYNKLLITLSQLYTI